MAQIFGDFTEQCSTEKGSLELIFSPDTDVLKKRWRNNRLSAYFVADYLSTFIPIDEDTQDTKRRIKETKGAISYVANELLENAMRYHCHDCEDKYRVKLGIYFLDNEQNASELTVIILTINHVDKHGCESLQKYIDELLSSDPTQLYIAKVEHSLKAENTGTSGLGLLTMINDYSAKLGWKLGTIPEVPGIFEVTTMTQLRL